MAKYSNEDGVWRTIKGRHIFIKKGQSINDALKESENYKKNKSKQSNEDKEREEYIKEYLESTQMSEDELINSHYKKEHTLQNANLEGERQKQILLNERKKSERILAERQKNEDDDIIKSNGIVKTYSKKSDSSYTAKDFLETKDGRLSIHKLGNDKYLVFNYETGEYLTAKDISKDTIRSLKDYNSDLYKNSRIQGDSDIDAISEKYPGVFLKTNNDYFGREQYEKYGNTLSDKYGGTTISKRFEDIGKPNSVNTVAKQIGINDPFEVEMALEGMVKNNKAKEITDGVYTVNKNYPQLTRNGTLYNITEHKDEGYYKGISATGRSFVGKAKEKYKIENPNDASDWGWIEREEYDKLTSKEKLTDEADIARRIRQGKMNKDDYFMNDTYSLGKEKEGYYVQFQDYPYHEGTLDLAKHRRTSPKNDTRTWARVWRDGENIYNKERQHKMQARADVAKFLEGEKSYSTLVQSYMKAGFSKAQAEAFAKYQLRRRK